MGWFDDQIRERIIRDDEAFEEAMLQMAGVVMGSKVYRSLENDRIKAKNAIEEVLKFYHVKPEELPENINDINDQMEYLMRPSGIMRRVVELEDEWYKDAIGAMLAIRKDSGVAVALIPSPFSGYTFFDTEKNKKVKLTKKTAELFETEAICFYKPLPVSKIGVKELLSYMAKSVSVYDYIAVAIAIGAVSLIGLLIPRINNLIYSYVIEYGTLTVLLGIFTFFIGVKLSQILVGVIKSLLMNKLTTKINIQVQAATMMRVLSLPADFFKNYSSGDLAARMGYINSLCSILINAVLSSGLTSIFSLVYLTQMAAYGPALVAPAMTVIAFTVIFSIVTTVVQINISKKAMEARAKESGLDYALITGIQKIKLAGAEKRAFAKWAKAYKVSAKLDYDPPAILKFSPVISSVITLGGNLVMYYFAVTTGVALADYFAFQSAFGMIMGAFGALTGMISSVAQIKPILDLVEPILKTEPEISTGQKVVTRLSGVVELNHVSFRYKENMPNVIDDISLKIKSGQYVAIVGKTGCGKSTLMRLMLGFEKAQKGAIYYDGKDINSLDLKSLRRHIGTVMQNGKLFQGDIFSNIAITAPNLTMEGAWEAAEMAGISEDIRHMPMGMHTMISEGSGGVSGGKRQRLMIARAIASKPKILMFDEATSALDNMTQKIVSDSLESLKCTRIVIAHRLSTIRHCDRIIVLDGGKIIEDGTYEQLIEQNGFFAELISRQRLDTETK